MTRQELFTKVVLHARAQGKQATLEDNGACRYRTPDGLKCFIGALIPDDRYLPSFEGKSVSGFDEISSELRRAAGIAEKDSHFARELQRIHDMCPMDKWEEGFYRIAFNHKLTLPT